MDNKLKYGLVGLIIGVLAVWGFTTFVSPNMLSMVGGSNQQVNSDDLDAHFIEQMTPHHEDAITMAKLAQTRAQKPEIKELAQNIIVSQGKEIEQMRDWYKSWFGKEVSQDTQVMGQHGMTQRSTVHMGIRGDELDMTRLEQAEDFDVAFVEHMIPHHQMAVMMAEMLKDATVRPEMSKLADDIIAAQTAEIDQMREWLKEWE